MKQLLILSGKGGTGKTTVAGAFIRLSQARACADCDVDAPNLHLTIKRSKQPLKSDYFGLPKAQINTELCTLCGACEKYCRFGAVLSGMTYIIDPFACEGCAVCEAVCAAGAISMYPAVAGELMLYNGSEGVFSTARLKMGSGTSGKLVTQVKKQMLKNAGGAAIAIIDGSPGIGCPVIASVSGADLVLIVAEPSISGISDLERIVKTARTLGVKIAVCVNKHDTNPEKTADIESFCEENALPYTGRIPFDAEAQNAINAGQTIADIDCPSGRAVREVYEKTTGIMFEEREVRL